MDKLSELIKEAYQLFDDYKIGKYDELAVCSCCVSEEDAILLKTLHPSDMPSTLIYEYLGDAQSDDIKLLIYQMKSLLPRILECLVAGEYLRHNIEIILDKLNCHQLSEWTLKELDFLYRFAEVYFEWKLVSQTSDKMDIGEHLIMFHLAGIDVTVLFNQWLEYLYKYPLVIDHMVNFIVNDGQSRNPFANQDYYLKVEAWLLNKSVRQHIAEAMLSRIEDVANSPDVWKYEVAFNFLSMPVK